MWVVVQVTISPRMLKLKLATVSSATASMYFVVSPVCVGAIYSFFTTVTFVFLKLGLFISLRSIKAVSRCCGA